MPKFISLFFAKLKYKKTLERTRYRLKLWRFYRREESAPLGYYNGYVKVEATYEEMMIRNFNSVFAIGVLFKSTPSGTFIADDSFRSISLSEEDKAKGFKNPFAEAEVKELETLGRTLTVTERRQNALKRLMDSAERKKFGY